VEFHFIFIILIGTAGLFPRETLQVEKKVAKILFLFLFLLILVANACSTSATRKDAPVTVREGITEDFSACKQQADEALFLLGLSFLPDSLQNNDYKAVKHSFMTLINDYPGSRRSDNAYTLLRLIEELELYQDKLSAEGAVLSKTMTEQARIIQEDEQLKKEIRLLNEKFQTELTTLQQENEQLKKDLKLLKNLEMQLEKREKTLR